MGVELIRTLFHTGGAEEETAFGATRAVCGEVGTTETERVADDAYQAIEY
jgi:hypothetical protein